MTTVNARQLTRRIKRDLSTSDYSINNAVDLTRAIRRVSISSEYDSDEDIDDTRVKRMLKSFAKDIERDVKIIETKNKISISSITFFCVQSPSFVHVVVNNKVTNHYQLSDKRINDPYLFFEFIIYTYMQTLKRTHVKIIIATDKPLPSEYLTRIRHYIAESRQKLIEYINIEKETLKRLKKHH